LELPIFVILSGAEPAFVNFTFFGGDGEPWLTTPKSRLVG
jgi:hypothetical protein